MLFQGIVVGTASSGKLRNVRCLLGPRPRPLRRAGTLVLLRIFLLSLARLSLTDTDEQYNSFPFPVQRSPHTPGNFPVVRSRFLQMPNLQMSKLQLCSLGGTRLRPFHKATPGTVCSSSATSCEGLSRYWKSSTPAICVQR